METPEHLEIKTFMIVLFILILRPIEICLFNEFSMIFTINWLIRPQWKSKSVIWGNIALSPNGVP